MKKRYTVCAWLLCLAILFSMLPLVACKTTGADETGTGTASETVTAADATATEPTSESEPATDGETSGADETGTDVPSVICNDPELVYTYTEEQYQTLCDKVDQLYALLASNDRQEEFLKLYEDVENNDYETLMDQYQIANIRSMMYTSDQTAADCLEGISEKYNQILQKLIEMYDDIEASGYAEAFFEGWSAEERARAVESAGMYTDELTELNIASDKLTTEYRALSQDDTFMQKSAEIYMRAIEQNNRIANLCGYQNYMEYAYARVYSRDYTPADVASMREMVKEVLAPMLPVLLARLQELGSQLTGPQVADVNTIMGADLSVMGVVPGLGTNSSKIVNLVDRYLASISEDMKQSYHKMWDSNRYILTFNSETSHAGAFSAYLYKRGYPLFYFGPGYQDLFTVIHEYGHCYAMSKSETMSIPMDLAEVNSQGNEWLFLSFLRGNIKTPAYEYLVTYRLFSDIANICNCVAVNDFETYVYTHNDYTAETLDSVMKQVLEDLGVYESFSAIYEDPTSYWHYVTIENPGYYISYAMSLLPSLDIFAMSLDNYETAAAAYLSLATVGEHDTFLETLKRTGIGTPFDRETYRNIAEIPERLNRLLHAGAAA